MQRNLLGVPLVPLVLLVLLPISNAASANPPPPVVGGTRVAPGAWPDVVAVLGPHGSCTGTLIAPDVVLTAGHCADIAPTHIIANTVDYAVPYAGDRIAVKWTRAYPRWAEQYDVAVLMLEHVALPRPRAIATGCLANRALRDARPLTVVGFGLTSPLADDDNTALHEASVPVLDPTCASDLGCAPEVQPYGEFSAGGRGTDSCFGDSGGPAFISTSVVDGPRAEDPVGPVLVGVVSRGLALPGIPCGNGGIYVRADKVTAWIERITKRKLTRVGCGGPADDPEIAEAEDEADGSGGCDAGGARSGTTALLGLALLAAIRRLRT
ncbi:MAG: trypsin-like serine protease [Myxococcales bacterium]|nr:trypsin-like serine protease [Myxococcales bacterium]